MKLDTKKIIVAILFVTILALPTIGATQTTDSEQQIYLSMSTKKNAIIMNVTNLGEEPVNYTFVVLNLRPLIRYEVLARLTNLTIKLFPNYFFNHIISTNGTVPAHSSVEKLFPVLNSIRFSPIIAVLLVGNYTALVNTGYVFLGRVRFTRTNCVDL